MAEKTRQKDGSGYQVDADIEMSSWDQERINSFANLHAKKTDVQNELAAKQNQLQNVEDACEELILLDDDTMVPTRYGEVFVYLSLNETNKVLDARKNKILAEIRDLKEIDNELDSKMNDLKGELYAKFGKLVRLD